MIVVLYTLSSQLKYISMTRYYFWTS